MRVAYLRAFARLGLPCLPVKATPGALGGSGTEEFIYPSEVGEDTFVCQPAPAGACWQPR